MPILISGNVSDLHNHWRTISKSTAEPKPSPSASARPVPETGRAGLHPSRSFYAHLECLFFAEACRGQGVGARLLAGARSVALAEGANRMEWRTPAWNMDACRFCSREGAETEAKIRFTLHLQRTASLA